MSPDTGHPEPDAKSRRQDPAAAGDDEQKTWRTDPAVGGHRELHTRGQSVRTGGQRQSDERRGSASTPYRFPSGVRGCRRVALSAGTYRGHDEVVQGVFMPLVQDYEGFTVKPEAFVGEGDTVVSVGWYEGRFKATDKVARARFAHIWTVRDGKVTRFEQIVDSATFNQALN